MITHAVMFRWTHPLDEAESLAVHEAFEDMRGIAEVLTLHHGPDLGRRDGNADYVAIVTLPDWDALLRYFTHEAHGRVVEVTSGVTEARWSVQTDS